MGLGGYFIYKKGGIDYLKSKLSSDKHSTQGQKPDELTNSSTNYYKSKTSIFDTTPIDSNAIVFLGNSITDHCDWNELFGDLNIKNRGIGGDLIPDVIERLDQVILFHPQKIFLMIGINDVGRGKTIEEIESDYNTLIELIIQNSPTSELYLQSLLPTYSQNNLQNNKIVEINKMIADIATKHSLRYIDLFSVFVSNEGELDKKYSFDGIHINGNGYQLWKKEIISYVED